jgi:hypothetical protein
MMKPQFARLWHRADRQMRNSRFNRLTPIIMISDDQRPSALSVGFAAGASFFLYKPPSTKSAY